MKLQQIQEARYHGLHPLVQQIKDYVDQDVNINMANNFVTIPAGEEQVVFQDLTKLYGDPVMQKNVIPTGTLPRWITRSENHYYEFDVGHDDQPQYADAPYGINLYSAMNPIKEARYDTGSKYFDIVIDLVNSERVSSRKTIPISELRGVTPPVVAEFNDRFGAGQYYPASDVWEWYVKRREGNFYIGIGYSDDNEGWIHVTRDRKTFAREFK